MAENLKLTMSKEAQEIINNIASGSNFYLHYKGRVYEVISIGRHSETLEELVIYRRAQSGDILVPKIWCRPLEMWNEIVNYNGSKVKRFTLIKTISDEIAEIHAKLTSGEIATNDYYALYHRLREACIAQKIDLSKGLDNININVFKRSLDLLGEVFLGERRISPYKFDHYYYERKTNSIKISRKQISSISNLMESQ